MFWQPLGSAFIAIVGGLFALYGVVVMLIMIPYYNWQYAREHGFIEWALLGEIEATARAFIWPYEVFFSSINSTRNETSAHVIAAINYYVKSMHIVKKYDGISAKITESDWKKIIDLERNSLAEAEQADIDQMNRSYPGFGNHFREEFIKGTISEKNSSKA